MLASSTILLAGNHVVVCRVQSLPALHIHLKWNRPAKDRTNWRQMIYYHLYLAEPFWHALSMIGLNE